MAYRPLLLVAVLFFSYSADAGTFYLYGCTTNLPQTCTDNGFNGCRSANSAERESGVFGCSSGDNIIVYWNGALPIDNCPVSGQVWDGSQCVDPPPPLTDAEENCGGDGSTCLLSSNEDNLCAGGNYYEATATTVDGQTVFTQNGPCDASNPLVVANDPVLLDFATLEATALQPDSDCFTDIDGKNVCIDGGLVTSYDEQLLGEELLVAQTQPDTACSGQYGAFNCIDHSRGNSGCGSFNGEIVCYTLNGDPIDTLDPDNPLNGGNRDGNSTNDPLKPGESLTAQTSTERAAQSRDNNSLATAIGEALRENGIGTEEGEGEEDAGICDPTAENYTECITPESNSMPDHTVPGVDTFAEANENFYGRVNSSTLVSSFAQFKNIIPSGGGSCPPLTIDLAAAIGEVISTTIICDMVVTIKPILSPVMLLFWTIVAFRQFASA